MLRTFNVGASPTFTATFVDADDEPADPTEVVFIWKVPAGTETSYTFPGAAEITNPAVGTFEFTPPPIAARGEHHVRVKGTAGTIAANEDSIGVAISNFTNP